MFKKENKGFTIIEVLIVLAIAGLIMLIVFLAVPALQRSSRNNGRNADASRVAAAISECISNNGGKIATCDTNTGTDKLGDYIDITANQQLINLASTKDAAKIDTVAIVPSAQCNPDNNDVTTTGVSSRSYAVVWLNETNGGGTAMKCTQ